MHVGNAQALVGADVDKHVGSQLSDEQFNGCLRTRLLFLYLSLIVCIASFAPLCLASCKSVSVNSCALTYSFLRVGAQYGRFQSCVPACALVCYILFTACCYAMCVSSVARLLLHALLRAQVSACKLTSVCGRLCACALFSVIHVLLHSSFVTGEKEVALSAFSPLSPRQR
jgi:hypothetical protein